jgi:hypothetical protein
MGLVAKGKEYKLSTDRWLRRKAGSTSAWKEIQLDDVPSSVLDERRILTARQKNPRAIPAAAPPKITRHD